MIKLQIIGNLGKDCIVKEVNGKNVINFSVAHSERYKDAQGNPKERTTWVECAFWTDRTGIAPYLVKGQTVYAEGTPEADAYTNKENQAAATLRMRVGNVQLIGNKNNDNGGNTAPAYNSNNNAGYNNNAAAQNTNRQPAPVSNAALSNASAAVDDLPF